MHVAVRSISESGLKPHARLDWTSGPLAGRPTIARKWTDAGVLTDSLLCGFGDGCSGKLVRFLDLTVRREAHAKSFLCLLDVAQFRRMAFELVGGYWEYHGHWI